MRTKVIAIACLLTAQAFHSNAQMKGLLNNAKNKAGGMIRSEARKASEGSSAPAKNNATDVPPSATTSDVPPSTTSGEANNVYPGTKPIAPVSVPVPKRAGTIIFSSDIEALKVKEQEDESKLSTSFNLGSPIYFRAYYAKPLTDYVQELFPDVSRIILSVHGRFRVRFTVDNGKPFEGWTEPETFRNEWKDEWTSFKGALQATDDEIYVMQDEFRRFVAENGKQLTNGKHTIKMELSPFTYGYPETKEGKVIASGTFTMNVDEKSIDPNNTKLCLPVAHMHDAELEASIIKAFKAKGWKEQPQVVRIIGDKWEIHRHEVSGAIVKRSIDAVIGSTRADKCIMQEFGFSQDYDGSGYQKEVYLDGVGGQRDINCGCLKK